MPPRTPPIATWSRGRVVRWNDAEGYGFLVPDAGGPDLFFHATALSAGGRRPVPQDVVEFQPGLDERGRPRAVAVRFESGWSWRPGPTTAIAAGFLALVALALLLRGLPFWVLGWYLAASLASGLVYAVDKGRAERDERRIRETTLHGLDAAGGWPGGLIVSHALRHKTAKLSFRLVFWAIAAAHVVLWLAVLAGSRLWGWL